ncbi:MAG: SRPBCC domain-containing protein [Pseudonocardiales bacterium]|nr:SRPBCC domain-containing protein [Pseudonocardiales bacterium]
MPIPNTITRTVDLPHPQEKVWLALTTLDGLASWFGQQVSGQVALGEELLMSWDSGHQTRLAVKVVDPMSAFGYCWPVHGVPAEDPRRTYVEFRLVPGGSGTTLTVTESGFAQLPDEWLSSYDGNTQGWAAELGELAAHLDAA